MTKGAGRIFPYVPTEERLSKADRLRRRTNAERRMARCVVCLEPRDPRSYPVCDKCVARRSR
jgi:hypothetical protein